MQGRVSKWLFESALPWWLQHGVDHAHGGAVEALSLEGGDAGLDYMRLRVIGRQIYVLSHAHMLGWSNGIDQAQRFVDFLTNVLWTDHDAPLPRRFTRDGTVIDPTLDLYDHAFVLFAYAWHFRATGNQDSRDLLYRTIDVIERQFRHPTQPGFLHLTPSEGARLQNPHMHFAEACFAALQATGDNRFRDLGRELVDLFQTSFFDREAGVLRESFTDELTPITGPDGDIVEPGHQFEWTWILNAMRPVVETDVAADMRALTRFAERLGVDPATHVTCNAVGVDGRIIDGGSRIWPNTERLKAAVALHDLDGTDPSAVFSQTLDLMFDRYLNCQPRGIWNDAYNARGELTARTVPASTFYHIMLAFTEVLRIDPEA